MAKDILTREPPPEQLKRELAGRVTGFDVLQEDKMWNMAKLVKFAKGKKAIDREEAARHLEVCERTVSRYLAYLREEEGIDIQTTTQVEANVKTDRIQKLRKLMKEHPTWERTRMAKKVGVSAVTISIYLETMSRDEVVERYLATPKGESARKADNILELKRLLKVNPTQSRGSLSRQLGVSLKTLNVYLTEVR